MNCANNFYFVKFATQYQLLLKPRNKGEVKFKHAMHLIRLLLSGITVLKEGFIPVKVEEYRDELLAIRQGKIPWSEVNKWRLSLHKEFDFSFRHTSLPERPNYDAANKFLIKARRSLVNC
jgi:uncharacterized protein